MKREAHLVESSHFEFLFDAEVRAFGEQERLKRLVNRELIPAMGEVFDELNAENRMVRAERIHLELGEVDLATMEQELPSRFKKQLKAELLRIVTQADTLRVTPGDSASAGVASDSPLDTLCQFLATGALPWHAVRGGKGDVDGVLLSVLKENADGFVDILLWGQKRVWLERLSSQFSEQLLARLDAHLCARIGGAANRNGLSGNIAGGGSRSVSDPDPRSRRSQDSWRRRFTLLGRAAALPGGGEAATSTGDGGLLRRLSRSLISGRLELTKAEWITVTTLTPEIMAHALQRHGQRADVRQRLARGFPEIAIRDIIAILEPLEASYVNRIISSPELFERGEEQVPGEKARHHLFEYTLGYLIVDRGSRFNKKTYLESVVCQIAARENERVGDLLVSLVDVLSKIKVETAATREMRLFLGDMLGRREFATFHGAESAPVEPEGSGDARKRVTHLISHLDEPDSLTLLAALWGEVAANHKDALIAALFRDGGTPGIEWRLLNGLPETMLQTLTKWVVKEAYSSVDAARVIAVRLYGKRFGTVDAATRTANADIWTALFQTSIPSFSLSRFNATFDAIVSRRLGLRDEHAEDKERKDAHRPAVESIDDVLEVSALLDRLFAIDTEAVDRFLTLMKKILTGPSDGSSDREKQVCRDRIRRAGVTPLVARLSGDQFDKLTALMAPRESRFAIPYTHLLMRGVAAAFPAVSQERVVLCIRESMFRYLVIESRRFNGRTFIAYCLRRIAPDFKRHGERTVGPRLEEAIKTLVPVAPVLAAIMLRDMGAASVLMVETAPQRPRTISENTRYTGAETTEAPEKVVFVENAGIVLAAAFLPQLFSMLKLTQHQKFVDDVMQRRAVHLLQYIIDCRVNLPEYQLVLNKLLAGMTEVETVPRKITVTDLEKETIEMMTKGMITHWKILGNTTVQGFRESFLRRDGRLITDDDKATLFVDSKPFDILLDKIPWSFKRIKFPWMERALHVEWR